MASEVLVEIGTVRKTHGYEGELRLTIDARFAPAVREARFLFIGKNADVALPYEVENLRADNQIFRFAGLTSKEAAAPLRSCSVYLPEPAVEGLLASSAEDLSQEDAAAAKAYEKFIGFAVIDDDLGEVGAIAAVEAYPGQTLASVDNLGSRCLVPLQPDLIKGVDFTKKIVFMTLPEGLLDL